MSASDQITYNSVKNNIRPFVIPGSKNSPMRLGWMNGDYYYWMVNKNYPKGYPTDMRCDYAWEEELMADEPMAAGLTFNINMTESMAFAMDESKYEGVLFTMGENLTYSLGSDNYPVVTIGDKSYKSQNRLLTSDNWATMSSGTSGDNHPTKVGTWILTMTYDGTTLTFYRNGLVDQVINPEMTTIGFITTQGEGFNHKCLAERRFYACASPVTVQKMVADIQKDLETEKAKNALAMLDLPTETRTDLVLPASRLGLGINWTSSNEKVVSNAGVLFPVTEDTPVTLTASIGDESRDFEMTVMARDITKNVRYELPEVLDQTANTATGFDSNTYGLAPEGLLTGLRSYTVLITTTPKTMLKQPRLYDFGSGSGNSLFLRADALSAGIKYNGGTTTMVTSTTKLQAGTEYKMAVSYDAATKMTTIYMNGEEDVSGTDNQNEPYMLAELAADTRNYIGRTQWWDGSYKADNQDYCGTISDLRLYDVCLSRQEICEQQGIPYEEKVLPKELQNGDFESSYTVMSGSGVRTDRAIYQPEGWSIEYGNRNDNDLTALKTGDLFFDKFFAALDKPASHGNQTYWIRQNWGASTITLLQELRLPEGEYTLTMDLWKSGLGGDAVISVSTEGGATVTAPSLENKKEWQTVELLFESDGTASTTIRLSAKHNNDGYEKIIGFDNVVLTKKVEDGIEGLTPSPSPVGEGSELYDLSGRRVDNGQLPRGIYLQKGKKVSR